LGNGILEKVRQALEGAGFSAGEAYPGGKMLQITGPVAAFHLHRVDSGTRTATVEVTVLCPGEMGGSACEAEALKAASALQAAGAVCVQKGCVYDGGCRLYSVSILASFEAVTDNGACITGLDFQVEVNDVPLPWALVFSEERVQEQTLEFATRSSLPVAITPGSCCWNIRLEELVPTGAQETAEPEGEFRLRVRRGGRSELYGPCRWSSVTRSFSAEGLRRISKGLALTRKEEA